MTTPVLVRGIAERGSRSPVLIRERRERLSVGGARAQKGHVPRGVEEVPVRVKSLLVLRPPAATRPEHGPSRESLLTGLEEKLAFESELGSKGHFSNIERGLARPTVQTLQVLADRLGVLLLDLVTFPERDERQRLIDSTFSLPRRTLKKLAKKFDPPKLSLATPPEPTRKPRRRNKSEA